MREYSTGTTRLATARNLLGSSVRMLPRSGIADGIEAVRELFANTWFDAKKCRDGIAHLAGYRRDTDGKTGTPLDRPRHDRHSHAADAFRYLAMFVRMEGGER